MSTYKQEELQREFMENEAMSEKWNTEKRPEQLEDKCSFCPNLEVGFEPVHKTNSLLKTLFFFPKWMIFVR